MIIIWCIIILLLIFCGILFSLYKKEKNVNKNIIEINIQNQQKNKNIQQETNVLTEKKDIAQQELNQRQNELKKIQEMISNAEKISRQAFENYHDVLDKEYVLTEQEFYKSVELLNKSYDHIQNETLAEINQIHADLDKISSTKAAAIQAQLKEEEIQQQSEFYSLTIDEIDKREVKVLHSIEKELRDPRPIRMIIWQTYYSKKANELAARVLGSEEISGIYKITNKTNKMCYIGQAKKIRERWREHMKCGLGIDTPANNKLYQAMQKEGIDNFTFELLEKCSYNLLNEKEVFYIKLYDSYHFGYNSNSGNKNL